MDDPLIGTVVAERYLVERLIGEGGMGRVYRAVHLELERPVALKLLRRRGAAATPDNRERFMREARTASRLTHKNLAVVYDFGQWEGRLYLAMELLSGESLAAPLERAERLPQERAARILSQVASVLHLAHEAGILHRDLKPENVMLTLGPEGTELVKVVDFGLALLMDTDEERLTREGMVSGTPAYMSPEQCRGKAAKVDARADVYALGVMLYELLCNRLPFSADNSSDVLVQHLFKDPKPPSDRARGLRIHPALEALAMWALAKDPADRPASARVFQQELDNALALMQREQAVEPEALTPRAPVPMPVKQAEILVFEEDGRTFAGSPTAALRANSIPTRSSHHPDDPATYLADDNATVVIIDLRGDAEKLLTRLGPLLENRERGALPFAVALGPGDDIKLMSRAVALGFTDYVPEQAMGSRLVKVVKRLLKKAQRQGAR